MNEALDYPHFIDVEGINDVLPSMLAFTNKVNEVIEYSSEKLGILIDRELVGSSFLDIPFLILAINCEDNKEFLIRNIFISNIQMLESQTSVGAHLYSMLLDHLYRSLRRDLAMGSCKKSLEMKFKRELAQISTRPRMKDIHSVLMPLVNDAQAIEIFDVATELAGCDGQITVKNDVKKIDTIIEMSDTFSFNFGLDSNFTRNAGSLNREIKDPRVIVIDGIFEKAHEIERFLFHSSQHNESLVIVARAFSEEVTTTIAYNNKRGVAYVFPIVVPFDMYGANALKDIATITGGDVVSSLKGELISSIQINDHPIIKKIIAKPNNLLLKEDKNLYNIKKSLKILGKKRGSQKNDIVNSILDKRIKTLLPRHVEITMGKRLLDESRMLDQHVRKSIAIFNEMSWCGIIKTSDMSTNSEFSQFENDIISYIKQSRFDFLPAHSLIRALEAIESTRSLLLNTGVYVVSSN